MSRSGYRRRGSRVALCRGFTTIELLIGLAVAATIVAIALPMYQDSMRKSRRSEAFAAISAVQQMQERHRSSQPVYAASLTDAVNAVPPGLGMAGVRTANGYYDLAVALVGTGELGYIVSAVAVNGTSQASDANCKALAVRMESGNVRYAGAASAAAINWALANPDPSRCWAR